MVNDIFVFQYKESGHTRYGIAEDWGDFVDVEVGFSPMSLKGYIDGLTCYDKHLNKKTFNLKSGFPQCDGKQVLVDGRHIDIADFNVEHREVDLETLLLF